MRLRSNRKAEMTNEPHNRGPLCERGGCDCWVVNDGEWGDLGSQKIVFEFLKVIWSKRMAIQTANKKPPLLKLRSELGSADAIHSKIASIQCRLMA